jgi:hypothetical protein
MTPNKARKLAVLQMKTLLTYGILDDAYFSKEEIAEETARTMKAFLENDYNYLIKATKNVMGEKDTPNRRHLEKHIEMLETAKTLYLMNKGDGYIVQEHF